MSVFKCKMCGGTIEFRPGETVGTCDSCGTKQTLPRLDDEKRANLYDRANHFRRNNDFDKAMGIYEQILNEDNTDAEAYWSLVLCRYGVEYVEDPATHKRVPTVNRAQFTSIFDDDNYKSALQYADAFQRGLYESEAKAINEIQKGILAISQKEEPFDVFICYKETDANGRRTPDSVLANDLYHQLTQEGFKVFFARITLEDKLGTAYEPYIFAALNSARVMVVLGTKPEYFNAVWVKNEWSRYLSLVRQSGGKKALIPAYKDMDPYDLPDEFSHLQAQDMSKLGFMQDLIRGIKKIVAAPAAPVKAPAAAAAAVAAPAANIAPLLKRAFMFLEDGDWTAADEYCEKVLDAEPECAEAYLGKLMAELHVSKREALKDRKEPFDGNKNYQKAVRYGSDELKETLAGCTEHIKTRNENARLEGIYRRAVDAMSSAGDENEYKYAQELFESIREYKDSFKRMEKCQKTMEEIAAEKEALRKTLERHAAEEAATQKKGMRLTALIICVLAAVGLLMAKVVIPMTGYARAEKMLANGQYDDAIATYEVLDDYKDSEARIAECKHGKALALIDAGEYDAAYALLEEVGDQKTIDQNKRERAEWLLAKEDYNAAYTLLEEVGDTKTIAASKYDRAIKLIDSGDYDSAYALLEEIGNNDAIASSKYDRAIKYIASKEYESAYMLLNGLDYKDSASKQNSIRLQYEKSVLSEAKVGDYVFFGAYEQDNDTSNGKEDIEWLVLDAKDGKVLLISKFALDCKRYNASYTDVIWETCSLREWLNNDFIDSAFSEEEKAMIPTVTVSADKNPKYNTYPSGATQDKVFLLSIAEANKHFRSDSARQCEPTQYAVANGAYINSDNGNCWWWLRSPGFYQYAAAYVGSDGAVNCYGNNVYHGIGAVRPALWINLDS